MKIICLNKNLKAIFILCLLVVFTSISAQNYVRLFDATGIEPTEEEEQALEAAATELINEFPMEFRNNFAVFDVGFYSEQEFMYGGFKTAWDKVITEVESDSIYYIIFGRQLPDSKGHSKLWLKINLPKTGAFNCFSSIQFNLIETTLSSNGNNALNNGINFTFSELQVIIDLKNRINEMKDCCDSKRLRSFCSLCPNELDLLNYYNSNGWDTVDMKILSEGLVPIELNNPSNPNILNYCNYIYEQDGKIIDPYKSLEVEISSLNAEGLVAGVILSNFSLCSDPTQASFRTPTSTAVELFNSNFTISGKELVIVYHLWKNPDSNGSDKLFKKYLYANEGVLYSSVVPLSPVNIGGSEETNIVYPLTLPENCNTNLTNYEVTKAADGKYYGYKLENSSWVQKNIVEISSDYPTIFDPDQYLFGQHKASLTWNSITKYTMAGSSYVVNYPEKFPCPKCYDYAVGDHQSTSTEELIRKFYGPFGTNLTSHQNERDKLFNSFIYGKGKSVVWPANSQVSIELSSYEPVVNQLNIIQGEIEEYLDSHNDLDGLFSSTVLLTQTSNPDLSSIWNPWMFQMFGGTQGREIKVVKFKKQSPALSLDCPSAVKYEIVFKFTLIDCFGLGMNEKWYLPGVYSQWVLQHYRNNYCCDGEAFSPVVNHKVEFLRSFIYCKP